MSIQISKKEEQAKGSFNHGEIIENKPIGFTQDGGKVRPYSNLFYWAHASSKTGSTIGLHPHKGFEIVSYVLRGTIGHYDTKTDKWWELDQGSLQVIKSGNGIAHSEEVKANSAIFQIWFDPNLTKSLYKEAEYKDYEASSFKTVHKDQISTTNIVGDSSPVDLDTEGIEMKEILVKQDTNISINPAETYSIYVLNGSFTLNREKVEPDDFIIVNELDILNFGIKSPVKIFVIKSPRTPTYATYSNT
ncbi:MAG: pirin family protein [Flavobacteriales bacterium]|nr:pirin family protein [Flavobacteriales bacterium]MDG1395904.1 pirin family protein [Flavobacteriales bacterium]